MANMLIFPQFIVEDVTGHSFLSTNTENVIDLAQHPTYVILDLGCTKSMGSRYADYAIVHSSSKFSFAKSETTTVHQALKVWFPTQPPMFTLVDIVEQGRIHILFSSTNEEPQDAT